MTTRTTPTRRQGLWLLASTFLLSSCEAKPMSVSLEVVLFSYLDRPIFDVLVNGTDIGVSNAYPTTGGGSMMGVELKQGPLRISWRLDGPEGTPRNGETVRAKNSPVLEKIERKHKYLAVHVMPDDTAEIELSEQYPHRSASGIAMHEARKKSHGK